nr:MAG TPA_asm: hypothetical protein [Caudoviricetes sp.]
MGRRKPATNKLVITGAGYASDEQRPTQRTITRKDPHGANHYTTRAKPQHTSREDVPWPKQSIAPPPALLKNNES